MDNTAHRILTTTLQRGVLFPALAAICEIRGDGMENLSGDQPAIIVANHQSILDALVVVRSLPPVRRRATAVTAAADYFFRTPLRARIVSSLGQVIPVDRGGAGHGEAALHSCTDHLERGGSIIIFPEGTRSCDGTMQRFRHGAARLAIRTATPLIPMGLHGLGEILPKGAHVPRPGAAWINVGTPLSSRPDESAEALTARIEATVRSLAAEAFDRAHPHLPQDAGFPRCRALENAGH